VAKTSYGSVDEVLATQTGEMRGVLERVRQVLRKALPDAEETISYQIPAYRIGGRAIVYFAGWKAHYSIYPATAQVLGGVGDALARYEVSKGTIRFPLEGRVPTALIARIARLRAREEAERVRASAGQAKAPGPTRGPSRAARPRTAPSTSRR
jgi:uncharacterized protein YdhG (YjbR/CyaY superfamily)